MRPISLLQVFNYDNSTFIGDIGESVQTKSALTAVTVDGSAVETNTPGNEFSVFWVVMLLSFSVET